MKRALNNSGLLKEGLTNFCPIDRNRVDLCNSGIIQSTDEAVTPKKIERTLNTSKSTVNLNHVQIFGSYSTVNTLCRRCKFQSKLYSEMEIMSTCYKSHKN